MSLPGDIEQWLSGLNLKKRVASLQKNLIVGFVDGVVIMEIANAMYPKMLPSNFAISETLNTLERVKNWELLQRKVLSVIHCDIGKDDIRCIATKQIEKTAILSFLRLLRIKLEAYKSTYDSAQNVLRTQQKVKKTQPSTIPAAAGPADGQESSVTVLPSQKRTKKILNVLKSREKVRLNVANMSNPEAEIEQMYNQVTDRYKVSIATVSQRLDEQQKRSQFIDTHIAELRSHNLDEIKRIENKLLHLHIELNHMKNGIFPVGSLGVEQSGVDETSAGSPGAIKIEQITRLIMAQLGLRTSKVQLKSRKAQAMEEGIRRKSVVLLNQLGLSCPGYVSNVVPFQGVPHDDSGDERVHEKQASTSDAMPMTVFNMNAVPAYAADSSSEAKAGNLSTHVGEVSTHDKTDHSAAPVRIKATKLGSSSVSSAASHPSVHSQPISTHLHAAASSTLSAGTAAIATATVTAGIQPASQHVPPPTPLSPKPAMQVTHKREFDGTHRRHYYVDVEGGKSSWHVPPSGVVECKGDDSRVFYINCSTKKTAWTLDALE